MIFVTGGTGLVGSHLLFELVLAGKKVRALKREKSSFETIKKLFSWKSTRAKELFNRIEWITGDITDIGSVLDAMEGTDTVYHCAACISFDPSRADYLRKVNVEGTANMVNAALSTNIKIFCHVSSVAAFGDWPDQTIVTEETFWKGAGKNNHYSHTKYGAEREVWRGVEEGLNALIVNPGVIIGPGNWNEGSSQIFHRVWEGIRYFPAGGANYVDVRDVVSLMIRLTEEGRTHEKFILVSESLPIKDFMKLMCVSLGMEPPVVKVGRGTLRLAAFLEGLSAFFLNRAPRLTGTLVNAISSTTIYSSEKTKKLPGFAYIKVVDSIQYTAKLFLEEITSSVPAVPSAQG